MRTTHMVLLNTEVRSWLKHAITGKFEIYGARSGKLVLTDSFYSFYFSMIYTCTIALFWEFLLSWSPPPSVQRWDQCVCCMRFSTNTTPNRILSTYHALSIEFSRIESKKDHWRTLGKFRVSLKSATSSTMDFVWGDTQQSTSDGHSYTERKYPSRWRIPLHRIRGFRWL